MGLGEDRGCWRGGGDVGGDAQGEGEGGGGEGGGADQACTAGTRDYWRGDG